jgi:hypothetical protein
MTTSEFRKLIREEVRKVMTEAGQYSLSGGGQGSGSQRLTRNVKGKQLNINDVNEGDHVTVHYRYDGGQGSGSQGTSFVTGIVKSIDRMDMYVIPDNINDYKPKYRAQLRREGEQIRLSNIIDIALV